MKNRFLYAIMAIILSLSIFVSSTVSTYAGDIDIGKLISILTGTGTGEGMNLAKAFADFLKEQSNDESIIDKFVSNLKKEFGGVADDPDDVPVPPEEESIVLSEGEAANIAELYNISVNEIKKGTPGFTKTMTATMNSKVASSLQGGLGPVTGIVESLIGEKDLFAGVIDGTSGGGQQVRTFYNNGNDIKNNVPLTGKNYVASLKEGDIKDYTITIYRNGAYKMHLDLVDVEGSAAASGLANVFDTTDKAFATVNFGTSSINIDLKFKYVNNFVECEVNKSGQITKMVTHMGITFLFPQEDGSYSPEMPYLGVNFEKEGIVYEITTEYTNFNFNLRMMGDANNDGKVNSTDARLVLRGAMQLDEIDDETRVYCDVNQDGKLSATDARLVMRAATKLETLKTTEEIFGVKPYVRSESTSRHVTDLLVLIMAYQQAKTDAEQDALQKEYLDKYNSNGSTTTEEETTTDFYSTGDKIDDIIDGIGGLIGDLINR